MWHEANRCLQPNHCCHHSSTHPPTRPPTHPPPTNTFPSAICICNGSAFNVVRVESTKLIGHCFLRNQFLNALGAFGFGPASSKSMNTPTNKR